MLIYSNKSCVESILMILYQKKLKLKIGFSTMTPQPLTLIKLIAQFSRTSEWVNKKFKMMFIYNDVLLNNIAFLHL
jgi:hypothetical protein